MSRACRYCKSPARGNPCWWFLDNPDQSPSGGDPPCFGDEYAEDQMARERSFGRNWLVIVGAAIALGLAVFGLAR